MKRELVPTYVAKDIFEIDSAFYKKIGVTNLFIDIDNTLDSCRTKTPSERVVALLNTYKDEGLNVYITSNNSKKRVRVYMSGLEGFKYIGRAFKPWLWKLGKFIRENNIDLEETLVIGDQVYTDVNFSSRHHVRCVLTEPIVEEDQLISCFNRWRDQRHRAKLAKQNKLINWRSV
ncbi:MAG: hypothetical protein LUC31_02820 [Coprobacillus sp.]|nr:hypothetical protein [Coprobacillus sp.]